MRVSCWCSFDSDRCSSRCVRTIRWHCAEHATGLTRPSSSGPRSATAAISATADSISESPSSPTRGRARISYRRSHWLGWRLSPAPRHLQRFRSVSRPDVERGSGWTFTRGPGSPPCPARDDRVTWRHYASQSRRFGRPVVAVPVTYYKIPPGHAKKMERRAAVPTGPASEGWCPPGQAKKGRC